MLTNDVTIWRIRVACWNTKATCSYAHATPTRPGTHIHEHACAHEPLRNTYYFFTATMIRKRASILRYTYIVPLIIKQAHAFMFRFLESRSKIFQRTGKNNIGD
jgi:hypothetical protein